MKNKNFKMDNLKEIREKKNMSQVNLSVKVGLSQEVLSHYEIGNNKPNVDNLLKLADCLKCSTDYLLGRTNNPAPIPYLEGKDIELAKVISKYTSLTEQNKISLFAFMDYLIEENKTNEKTRDGKKKH